MSSDANQSQNDTSPDKPRVHTATLSEPKASPGDKPAKAKKPKKQKPEPTTPMGKLWHNWVKPIGSVIVIVVVFRSMLLDWNDVPTGSMEPEIHVGDRIAVNRLAYGLQFPLTGPTIGIPFTPIQFPNPLDGIPQIEWGDGPQRGDIVTFWNPVSDVRMVKRIVAIPGDTIEMRGGVMTINGQTATYTDLDPVAEGLPTESKVQSRTSVGTIQMKGEPVTYRTESLLGLTRTAQSIEKKWITDLTLLVDPIGKQELVQGDTVPDRGNGLIPSGEEITIEAFLSKNPGVTVEYRIEQGVPYLGDQEVSFNEFASFLLKNFQQGDGAKILDKIGLAIEQHQLIVDSKPVFIEQFMQAVKGREGQLLRGERQAIALLNRDLEILHSLLGMSFGPYTVPEDGYLMIGDNRNNSSDGRYFGPVKRSEITGKAFAVAFSFKDNKMFAIPPEPAWSRFFKDLD